MRTLITGGTGFIGRALAAQVAAEAGAQVSLLLRETRHGQELPAPLADHAAGFQLVYADLRDAAAVRRALHEAVPQIVFHLAAAGVSDPFLDVDTALAHNLIGTLNLLRAAFEHTAVPPQQFIVVRTPGEDSAMNPYAASKAAAWQFCRMYARTREWPITGAKIFQTYGPGQDARYLVTGAMSAALAGQDFPLTAGTQERDWIYVTDAAEGLRAVRDGRLPPGSSVDLGSGQTASVAEVVRLAYDVAGGSGRPLPGVLPSRPGEEARQVAGAARTKALLNWETAVTLPQGLALLRDFLIEKQISEQG